MEFPDEAFRDICSIKTLYSPKEGFFKDFVKVVLDEVDQNWIENVFEKEISDLDKIRACCNDTKIWSIIRKVLKNVSKIYRKKSDEEAERSLVEGNLLCKTGDYKKAVMIYSQSLIRAPKNVSDIECEESKNHVLSLAYKGRANALFHLDRFKECIYDLNMALKEKVPDSLKYRVFWQMGECYKSLLMDEKAHISFQISLKLLEEEISKLEKVDSKRMSKADKNEHLRFISALRKEAENLKTIMMAKTEKKNDYQDFVTPYNEPLPKITGAANDKYPAASNLIKIRHSDEAGRFAAAAERIDVGATLVVEEPQASVLIFPMLSSHCLHCFTRLFTPIPCITCSGVAFCSLHCRDSALSSYHKYECELMGLFLGSGMSILSHLALRMVTQESLGFFKVLLSKIKKSEPMEAFTLRELRYVQVYNLTTHSQLRTSHDYFRRTLMAIFLVECLKKTEYYAEQLETSSTGNFSENEMLTASIILHHLQLLQFNAHEIYETRLPEPRKIRDSKAVYIAVGIYPTAALFNHECAPSATRYFNGKSIVIKSVRPLEKNDILSENYGPNFGKKSLSERLRELTSRYWFYCRCPACLEDWPKIEDLTHEKLKIRCTTPRCAGTFQLLKSKNKSETRKQTCQICMQSTNVVQVLENKLKFENLFEKGLELMDEGKCKEAEPLLCAYINKVLRITSMPSREIFLTQEALRTCYAQNGNIWILNE